MGEIVPSLPSKRHADSRQSAGDESSSEDEDDDDDDAGSADDGEEEVEEDGSGISGTTLSASGVRFYSEDFLLRRLFKVRASRPFEWTASLLR